jgi:tetratricopeptide (TPR) repeat protein
LAKINPVKLKQDADKLEKAGKLDQAIVLFKQVVDDNPRDWNIVKKIGDLYVRLNKMKEAMVEYQKVADFYAKDGFHLKAIAIWKQINKLDATALEPYVNLAELYGKQGLLMEAKSQYQYVVDEYLKRGKNRDAGDVLKKMADIDPADLKVRSKLADLYTRDGNSAKAVDEHIAIAEELNKKGHLAEALQVLEKGLKIDPKSARMRSELARVHLVQKNYDKAAHYLEDAVKAAPNDAALLSRLGEAYLGSRKVGEAEGIFKRLLNIDPNSEDARVQMGRVYLMRDDLDRAHDEFLPVVEKMVARKEADKAAGLLQQIVQKDPQHVRSLARLVEIYQQFQKEGALGSAYSQLTEAYINAGQFKEAAEALEVLVGREPQNLQHRTKLDFVRGKLGGKPRAAAAPAPPPAPVEDDDEFDLSAALEAPAAPPNRPAPAPPPAPAAAPRGPAGSATIARPVVRPSIQVSGPLSEEEKEFIDEHLAEGKVFRKYGLVDKAADQFEAVVARFPDNLDARQELREVYREKGQAAKAAAQSLALAEIFRLRGDEAAAAEQEAEAGRLDPSAAPRAAAPSGARAMAPPPLASEAEDEEEIHLGVDEDEDIPVLETEEEVHRPAPVAPKAAAKPAAKPPAPEPDIDLGLDLDDEEELSTQFIDDEEPAPAPPLRRAPPAPAPPVVEEDFLLEEDTPSPLEDAGFEEDLDFEAMAPQTVTPLAARPSQADEPETNAPPELARVLDEVDSYISLGFVDDAKEALREARQRFADHPALAAKLSELGIDLAADDTGEHEAGLAREAERDPLDDLDLGPTGEADSGSIDDLVGAGQNPMADDTISDDLGLDFPESADAPAEGGIDLGDELNDLFGAQAAVEEAHVPAATDLGDSGLADIFKEFKKGVDKQLGKEDYDTRYNLGIAYKEMGLIDEAIAEFQLAAKDENRMLECSSMLGICFMEKGMPKLAVKWFDKGLKAPGRSEEEYSALRYDLATAHEAAGEAEAALTLFTDLYGQDANFRDVAAKVRELRASLG